MNVVGYTYDADIHCPKCTGEYVREQLGENYHHADEFVQGVLDGRIEFVDSENNPIHVVFDTDEAGDSPDHCGDCLEYIDTSWTGDTVKYVVEALLTYVEQGYIREGHGGDYNVLDNWNEQLAYCMLDSFDERVRGLYEYVREEETP